MNTNARVSRRWIGRVFTVAAIALVTASAAADPQRQISAEGREDRTGLTDRYTMELDYVFPPSPPTAAAPPEFAGPSLSTAVREPWGLRLVPSKGSLKVLVVESAQLPTAN